MNDNTIHSLNLKRQTLRDMISEQIKNPCVDLKLVRHLKFLLSILDIFYKHRGMVRKSKSLTKNRFSSNM